MKKDELTFLELFGNIEETYVDSALQPWKARGGQHRIYHLGRKVACLVLIAMLGFCLAYHNQVYAAIKRFTTMIGELLSFEKDLTDYTEFIEQTQTKNGITLTLKELILDEKEILMAFHVEDPSGTFHEMEVGINPEKTRINGKRYDFVDTIYSNDTGDKGMPERKGISGWDVMMGTAPEDLILPEGETKLHLVVNIRDWKPVPGVKDDVHEDIRAEFAFDLTITPEQLKARTVKKELDIPIVWEDKTLILKDMTLNDLYCKIKAVDFTWNDEWFANHDLKLLGEDSLGNPVSLVGGNSSENEMWFETSLMGDFEPTASEYEIRSVIPDKDCEYIDLQLYEREFIWIEESTEVTDGGYVYGESLAEFSEENNYGWKPVGEKFRVMLK